MSRKTVTTFENRAGHKRAFVGVWLEPDAKRRLVAMSLVRGQSASKVLRGLIDAAPIEENSNRAGVRQDTPGAVAVA